MEAFPLHKACKIKIMEAFSLHKTYRYLHTSEGF